MPQLGPLEIAVVLLVALLVFGPNRLPELARQVGGVMRELRRVQQNLRQDLHELVNDVSADAEAPPTLPPKEAAGAPDAPTADPARGLPPTQAPAAPPPATVAAGTRMAGIDIARTNGHVEWVLGRISQGVWEEDTFDLIDRHLPPFGTFIDIGAWVGMMTLYAVRTKHAEVWAFEPDPTARAALVQNLALNGRQESVDVLPFAVWSENGTTTLRIQAEPGDSMTGPTRNGDPLTVATVTPRNLRLLVGRVRPHLIKVDTEGSETEFLGELLREFPLTPVICGIHEPQLTKPFETIDFGGRDYEMTSAPGPYHQLFIHPKPT